MMILKERLLKTCSWQQYHVEKRKLNPNNLNCHVIQIATTVDRKHFPTKTDHRNDLSHCLWWKQIIQHFCNPYFHFKTNSRLFPPRHSPDTRPNHCVTLEFVIHWLMLEIWWWCKKRKFCFETGIWTGVLLCIVEWQNEKQKTKNTQFTTCGHDNDLKHEMFDCI